MRLPLAVRLIAVISPFTFLSAEPIATPAPKPDPIVGKWRYFNGHIVTITADGRLSSSIGPTGTWQFSNNKELERKYTLKWQDGLFNDELILSRDGNHLVGKNQKRDKVSADRVAP